MTKDSIKREQLIYFTQVFCFQEMLPSPSELIIGFVKAGCPLKETEYNLQSKLSIAQTWREIHGKLSKTFVFDYNSFKTRTETVRNIFKMGVELTKSVGIITNSQDALSQDRLWVEGYLKRMKTIDYESLNVVYRNHYKMSIILIFVVLCLESDMDNSVTKQFWINKGISDEIQRLNYLVINFEQLVYRGPIAVMSEMVVKQLAKGGKPTRGLFWDSLHSIYAIYNDYFFTADEHFLKFKADKQHEIFDRIIYLPKTEIFNAKSINII